MRRRTNEDFREEILSKLPNIELMSEYKTMRQKITVKCSDCGYIWDARAGSLYMGHGCPKCAGRLKTHEEFVTQVNKDVEVIGEYKNNHTNIAVKCKKCGYEWFGHPLSLIKKSGCPKCYGHMRKTKEQFIEEVKSFNPQIEIIGDYVNTHTKIECKCNDCGRTFFRTPHELVNDKYGCNLCGVSRGEKKIMIWLESNNIPYEKEYRFDDCRDKHTLPFDFYLRDKNTIIEYDGKQHFEANQFFGGEDGFDSIKKHDSIKNSYCESKNIKLIRIPYWDFENIEEILYKNIA